MTEYGVIYLSSLNKKQLEIANEVNTDGNDNLSGKEISIFLEKCEEKGVEYKPSKLVVLYNSACEFWDNSIKRLRRRKNKNNVVDRMIGTEIKDFNLKIEEKGTTENIKKRKIFKRDKNYGNAIIDIDVMTDKNGTTTVNYNRTQASIADVFTYNANFKFNKDDIEDYIVKFAQNNPATPVNKRYSQIFEIRNKSEEERTEDEKEKLADFDNMIDYIIQAGVDYGLDPKIIVAIIKKESVFGTLYKKGNGNGLMQLTKPAIEETFKLKNLQHVGIEVIELLESRNFKNFKGENTLDEVNTEQLVNEIYDYILKNQDPEFNVRLGTLYFRHLYKNNEFDIKKTATCYNGNDEFKKNYGKEVLENYNQLSSIKEYGDSNYNFNCTNESNRKEKMELLKVDIQILNKEFDENFRIL